MALRANWSIPDMLRVCADPSNMPFTDESGEGFENKLAELVAEKTGRKSVAYTWFPDGHGLRPQHAEGQSLRHHHGLRPGRRTGAEHQRLLPLDLCAGLPEGQRARRRRDDRGSEAGRQEDRRRRRNAADRQHGGYQADAHRQDLSADGGYAPDAVGGRDHDQGHARRRDRRGDRVGADGRLLRQEIRAPISSSFRWSRKRPGRA